jgi:hypothetical protein
MQTKWNRPFERRRMAGGDLRWSAGLAGCYSFGHGLVSFGREADDFRGAMCSHLRCVSGSCQAWKRVFVFFHV